MVYTVAQNGYAGAYSRCIASHREYCSRHGFNYVAVTRPFRVEQPAHCAWLKIPLMLHALSTGYDWVAFIDSDAVIRKTAPDFRTIETDGKSVYMVTGRSGRVNSGVMMCKRSDSSAQFYSDVMKSLGEDIPAEDRAHLKFENGNVIYCAKQSNTVQVIPPIWNNTTDPELDDHIRHFTGPLHSEYQRSWLETLIFSFRRRLVTGPSSQPTQRDPQFIAELHRLTRWCIAAYPEMSLSTDTEQRSG